MLIISLIKDIRGYFKSNSNNNVNNSNYIIDDFNPPEILNNFNQSDNKPTRNNYNSARKMYDEFLIEKARNNTKRLEHIKAKFIMEIGIELTEWAKDNADDILSIKNEYSSGFSEIVHREITPINNLFHSTGNTKKANIQKVESKLIGIGYKYLREYNEAKENKLSHTEIRRAKDTFKQKMNMTIEVFNQLMATKEERENQIKVYHNEIHIEKQRKMYVKSFDFD
jgi:hypothetical protein